MTIRPIDEQFEPATVDRLRELQRRIDAIASISPGMGYLRTEVSVAIDAGLLLAPLMVLCAIMENCARESLIRTRSETDAVGDPKFRQELESDLELHFEDSNRPRWGFSEMIDELMKAEILDSKAARHLKDYYRDIRIPLCHGLARRFLISNDKYHLEDLFGRRGREHRIEDVAETRSIDLMEQGLELIEHLQKAIKGQQDAGLVSSEAAQSTPPDKPSA